MIGLVIDVKEGHIPSVSRSRYSTVLNPWTIKCEHPQGVLMLVDSTS